MTTQAEELLGAQLSGADGKAIGAIEQVFGDDSTGAPAWARVRYGKTSRFVPLGSAEITRDGRLSVPFEAQQIVSGPKLDVENHISSEQADELKGYYQDLSPSPAPAGRSEQRSKTEPEQGDAQQARNETRKPEPRSEQPKGGERKTAEDDWLLRREERMQVGKETTEAGRVKLRRYVDAEPAEETVRLFHEEYDVERVPVSTDEPTDGDLQEDEMEITLFEEQGIVNKETVPVERMRIVAKRIEEEETFRDELRHERIEVEPEAELETTGRRRNNRSR